MTEGDSAGSQAARPARRQWYRDWRFWTGIAITVVCMWYAMRGISLASVASAMGNADQLLLFGLSVPAYLAAIYVRGLRWRHLTNPFESIPRGVLARGVAVGFMVNNLLPLRIGEFVRSWYVAREVGTSGSAILGTVVLERVIDVVCVMGVAVGALALAGVGSEESGFLHQGALLLLPVAIAPLGGLILIRAAPEWVIAVALQLPCAADPLDMRRPEPRLAPLIGRFIDAALAQPFREIVLRHPASGVIVGIAILPTVAEFLHETRGRVAQMQRDRTTPATARRFARPTVGHVQRVALRCEGHVDGRLR